MEIQDMRDLASEYYLTAGFLEIRRRKNEAIKYHSMARALFDLIEYVEEVRDCDEELERLVKDEDLLDSWKRIGGYLVEHKLRVLDAEERLKHHLRPRLRGSEGEVLNNIYEGIFPLNRIIDTPYLFGREKLN